MKKSTYVLVSLLLLGGILAASEIVTRGAFLNNLATVFELNTVSGPNVTIDSHIIKTPTPASFTLSNGGNTALKYWKVKVDCAPGITIGAPSGLTCGTESTISIPNTNSSIWKLTLLNSAKDTRQTNVNFRAVDRKNRTLGTAVIALTLLPPCKNGDADCNTTVDSDDFSRIDQGFNSHGTTWAKGDFDGNGVVDFDDYSIINTAFNTEAGISLNIISPNGGQTWTLGSTSFIKDESAKLQDRPFTTYLVAASGQKYSIDQGTFAADGIHNRSVTLTATQVPIGQYFVKIFSTTSANVPISDQSDGSISVVNPAPVTYSINASAGTGGAITPQGTASVPANGNIVYTISPSTGNQIAGLMIDGSSFPPAPAYTFSNVTSNHTIAATFSVAPPTVYTITASAGPNGSVSPTGNVQVTGGQSKTFTILPNSGYQTASVIVDGSTVAVATSYTFPSVTANHSISATFSAVIPPPPDTINVSAYGAIPNDGLDDRNAIQAAINAATAGKTIVFNPGVYNLKSVVTLKANITLTTATGAKDVTLDSYIPVGGGSSYAFTFSDGTGLKVTNLKFKANNGIFAFGNANTAQFMDNEFQWGYEGDYYHRLAFTGGGANGLKIERNYFHDSESSDRNLEIRDWANGTYSFNKFYKINDGGHIMDPGDNVTMEGNIGRLIHRMGIEVQQVHYPPGIWPKNFIIKDNVFYDWNKPYWDSMGLSVPLAGISVTIQNNYLKQNAFGGIWGEADGSGNVRGSYGIEAPQAPAGQPGGIVDGNTIISERNVAMVACPGVNTTVRNNKFYGPAPWYGTSGIGGEPGSLGGGSCTGTNNLRDPDSSHGPVPPQTF